MPRFFVDARIVDGRVALVGIVRLILGRKLMYLVGTCVTIFSDDDVTIIGDLKDYEDKTTDSGMVLHRWFCGNCGW